jgi:hypothetical protein
MACTHTHTAGRLFIVFILPGTGDFPPLQKGSGPPPANKGKKQEGGSDLLAAAKELNKQQAPVAPLAAVHNGDVQSMIMTFVSKLKEIVTGLQKDDDKKREVVKTQSTALYARVAQNTSMMLIVGTWITVAGDFDALSLSMELKEILGDSTKLRCY